ncbi:MAG: hypothetical protein HYV97_14660 [Bdellovibrio sp.]|nr:hypothetical protein [Bdellovibrio sp.]
MRLFLYPFLSLNIVFLRFQALAQRSFDQITGEYTPGLAGMMVLELGLEAIKKLSLNEKGTDFINRDGRAL